MDAARGDDRHFYCTGQFDGRLDINATHHAVTSDIGINDGFNTETFIFFGQFDHIVSGEFAPAVRGDLAVFCIQPDDDLTRKDAAGILQKPRILDGCRSDDDVRQTVVKITFNGVEIANATTQLHGDFVQIVIFRKILHYLKNVFDGRLIDRLACESAVQVNQMKPSCALFKPVQCHFSRIFRKYSGLFHIALFQADAGTIFQINSGNKQHD